MTPRSPSDTPANGDFARYVEQLGPSSASPGATATPSAPVAASHSQPRRPPRTAQPARGPASPLRPLWRWVQWGIVLYVVVEVFTSMFPAYRGDGTLLLLIFFSVAFLRLRELPWLQILGDLGRKK